MIESLFIIIFGICVVFLGAQGLLSHLLFRSLRRGHGSYYKSIGEPIVIMPTVHLTDTEDDLVRDNIRCLKSGVFVYRMVFRGIPKSFPKDARLRKLARAIRIVSTIMLVSFVTFIVVAYFFYKSTS